MVPEDISRCPLTSSVLRKGYFEICGLRGVNQWTGVGVESIQGKDMDTCKGCMAGIGETNGQEEAGGVGKGHPA